MQEGHATSENFSIFAVFIRIIALAILAFGLWIAYQILQEGWKLYRAPETILPFASKVEEGGHLNQFAESLGKMMHEFVSQTVHNMPQAPGQEREKKELPPLATIRFSYFAAWGIVVLLLLVIGKIAFWAIKTGAELCAGPLQSEKIGQAMARQIVYEMRPEKRE